MTFEEKNTWIQALVTILSLGAYLVILLGRPPGIPLREAAYVAPMLGCMGGAIGATILGHILVAVIWPRECGKKDVRDREIHRFGEYVGQSLLCVGGAAALFLSMARVDHFWIAQAVYLCFGLSSLLGAAAKIVAYRWGFPRC